MRSPNFLHFYQSSFFISQNDPSGFSLHKIINTCRVPFIWIGIEEIAYHSGKLIRIVRVNFAVISPDNFLGQDIHIPSPERRFQMQ